MLKHRSQITKFLFYFFTITSPRGANGKTLQWRPCTAALASDRSNGGHLVLRTASVLHHQLLKPSIHHKGVGSVRNWDTHYRHRYCCRCTTFPLSPILTNCNSIFNAQRGYLPRVSYTYLDAKASSLELANCR